MENILFSSSQNLILLFGLGLALGLKHALDADHISAVSTLVGQTTSIKKSSTLGFFWGAGHTTTLFIFGLLVLVFKLRIPDKMAVSFELLVGVLLVFLGVNVLLKIRREKIHIHSHEHGGDKHMHLHSHKDAKIHNHKHLSFLVGMLHGLAGSGALMLLVFATTSSILEGLLFVIIFGIGSTIGMLLISSLISLPFIFSKQLPIIDYWGRAMAGILSILIGASIIYDIGITKFIL